MTINTDYAQYWAYGHKDEPIEPQKPKEDPPIKNDVVKKFVINPGWLNKKRGKAKL